MGVELLHDQQVADVPIETGERFVAETGQAEPMEMNQPLPKISIAAVEREPTLSVVHGQSFRSLGFDAHRSLTTVSALTAAIALLAWVRTHCRTSLLAFCQIGAGRRPSVS